MVELVREQLAGVLERRQWWSLGSLGEAMVVYGKDICSIHITDENKKDISTDVAKKLGRRTNIPSFTVTATIDSYFIECQKEDIENILKNIESVY